MVLKKSFLMDDSNNPLRMDPIDDDGFHVSEIVGEGKIYIYYSEIDVFITCLKRIKKMNEGE